MNFMIKSINPPTESGTSVSLQRGFSEFEKKHNVLILQNPGRDYGEIENKAVAADCNISSSSVTE